MTRYFFVTAAVLAAAAGASAQVIDGTADASYGPALAVQNTQTGFGDSNLGQVNFANGSELDGLFGYISGGNLNLVLTGNLESNYNKLELFFDTRAGGQNQLRGDNPNVSFNGLNRMGDDGSGNGLRFDTGFGADFWFSATGGDAGGGNYGFFVDYSEILTGGGGSNGYFVGGNNGQGALSGGNNPFGVQVAINNSNVAGVTGGNGLASGAGVITGVEFSIPLSALGDPTGPIAVCAFVNGSGHDYVSNQVLGGIGGGDNLADPRNVNFSQIAGDQFVVVVPAPASLALLGLGGVVAGRRRRA